MQPGQHRPTARILLLNDKNQVFLLKTHFDPEVGLPPRWITPGGGIDAGETPIQAAQRELFEETGLKAATADLGEIVWQTSGRWDWADGVNHHTYEDIFFELRISNFKLNNSNWTSDEHRDVVEFRWWNISDLVETDESVGPPGLAKFIEHHVLG